MSTSGLFAQTVAEVSAVARERARAEFVEADALACLTASEADRIEQLGDPLEERLERAAVVCELAAELGQSPRTIAHRAREARYLRRHCPATWDAFGAGDLDRVKASMIATTCSNLTNTDRAERLEARAAVHAARHTPTELRRWLAIEAARIEPTTDDQDRDARAGRRVHIERVGDGTSWLNALLPDAAAQAIESKLTRTVSAMSDDGDDRTTQQKRADVVAAWLTHGESTNPAISAHIGILVPWTTLTGDSDAPGVTIDRSAPVPADQVRELADNPDTSYSWCGIGPTGTIIDVRKANLLDITWTGRFAPESLKKAVAFRDGTCQAPGCTRPAEQCDYDHRNPHPNGPTNGDNIWPLCRLHHLLKTRGLLIPVQRDDGGWAWRFRGGTTLHPAEPFTWETPDTPTPLPPPARPSPN